MDILLNKSLTCYWYYFNIVFDMIYGIIDNEYFQVITSLELSYILYYVFKYSVFLFNE